MKYPKLWNGPSAVGEALVRALQMTGVPYLSAHTADGVYAGVMDGKAEVKQGGGDYVCCVYRTYETLNLLSRYPHGFYYVYLGVRSDTSEPDGRAEGYYANPTDAYLGPLQFSGRGVWMGDFWTWPFITSVDDTGYYTEFGEYAGPPAYSGGGPLMHRYALIDAASGVVARRGKFGPWEGANYRHRISYTDLPVWFRGGLRLREVPGSTDANTAPLGRYYSRFSRIKASLRTAHPDGVPAGFNPLASLDPAPIRGTPVSNPVACCAAARRLYWVEQGAGDVSRLHRLTVTPEGVSSSEAYVDLLSTYSWTIASDDKYIVAGGWDGGTADAGIIELYDLELNRIWHDYVPANDQPYQVAVGNGRVATVTINSPSEMFLWDLRELLRGVGPAGSRQAVPVGRRAPDGTPLPPFLGPGLGGRFYYPQGVAVKRRKVFVMHAGERYSDATLVNTGEITVEVFKLNGEYVKTIPVHTAAPGEGFADEYNYAIIQVPRGGGVWRR